MVFISATRLRLRSVWFLIPFIRTNAGAMRQLKQESAFLQGKTLMDRHLTFWTLTAWSSEKDMRAYRNNGAHLKAMAKLINWCDEATATHWSQEGTALPDWQEAYHHIKAPEAHVSKVYHPSQNHAAKNFPPPRYPSKLEALLVPQSKAQ